MSPTSQDLDPYTTKAEDNNATPQVKIDGYKKIVALTRTAMLTSRAKDGHLHSRAMAPVKSDDATQLSTFFIANNASHKFEELEHDSNVNISFIDTSSTAWASVSGTVKIRQDRAFIEKHWNSMTRAWFGDLKDGIHKGDAQDPRVTVIEVIPNEIRYWEPTRTKLGQLAEIVTDAVTGNTAAPGHLRTITQEEILLTQGLH